MTVPPTEKWEKVVTSTFKAVPNENTDRNSASRKVSLLWNGLVAITASSRS